MKISLAFLLLGTCLVFTNANVIGNQHAHRMESFSHARMMALPMKEWQELQNCHACSQAEKKCKERIVVSDCFFILKLASSDLSTDIKKLVSVKTPLKIPTLLDCLKNHDVDSYHKHLEKTNSLNHFMQFMCLVMQKPMAEAGLDMGNMLNDILGDIFGSLLSIVPGLIEALGGVVNTATGLLSGAVDTVTNIAGGLTGTVGGVTGTLSGLTGGLTGSLGGLTGGLGGLTGGLGGLGGGGKGYRG